MKNIIKVEVELESIDLEVSIPPYKNIEVSLVVGNSETELMSKFYYEWDKVWSKLLKWPDRDIKKIPTDASSARYDSSRAEVRVSKFSNNAIVCVLLVYEINSNLFVELDVKTWEILHVYVEVDSGNEIQSSHSQTR